MQTVIQIVCNPRQRSSLREAIATDKKLSKFRLALSVFRKQDRADGWAKLASTDHKRGAINMSWEGRTRTLECRVVTKYSNKPNDIIGDFLNYLLKHHLKKIKFINIFN